MTSRLPTRQDLDYYEREIRNSLMALKVDDDIIEKIVTRVIRPDNKILLSKEPWDWAHFHYRYYVYDENKWIQGRRSFKPRERYITLSGKTYIRPPYYNLNSRIERCMKQIGIICESGDNSKQGIIYGLRKRFEINDEKSKQAREDFDWAIEHLDMLLVYMVEAHTFW